MNKLICFTGLTGSGKTIASEYFVKKGFQYLRFGQITLDYLIKRKIPINERNERKVREDLRKKYGMGAFARLNLPKFRKLLKTGNTIGDGLYSFEEYDVLKKAFGKRLMTIAIYSPPETRYKRLVRRHVGRIDDKKRFRSTSVVESKSRDYAELKNLNKGAAIAMADYTILNTKDLRHFRRQLKELEKEIESK